MKHYYLLLFLFFPYQSTQTNHIRKHDDNLYYEAQHHIEVENDDVDDQAIEVSITDPESDNQKVVLHGSFFTPQGRMTSVVFNQYANKMKKALVFVQCSGHTTTREVDLSKNNLFICQQSGIEHMVYPKNHSKVFNQTACLKK